MNFLIPLLMVLSLDISQPKGLKDFRWEKRILLFFDCSEDSCVDFKEYESKISERKLLIVRFEGQNLVQNSEEIDLEKDSFLKVKNKEKGGSQWYLIGLDGGVKASGKQSEFDWDWIFRKIDSMPMRQSEIRIGVKN
ncbi:MULTISPECIES: DUF4174 domain-containing protein [Algoriphagus]|uniref:DUF4174 domain-containing protein n=2 Tax=Algoriphagus TaxID=246875 RepID=A0A4Y9QYP4_9BACT|nr:MULTISPECIES: DUF4174 domain-containing protein [Algoriphagus]MCS5488860.1 DUF4174 domain-containing protein [Algoriphagus limi]TFV97150.1 DUF4174 domain-containing protein [Algoriphagus kandeliae]